MAFDIIPWLAAMVVFVGLGPWVAMQSEPSVLDSLILTLILACSPAIVAEIAGRIARRRIGLLAEKLLLFFCYIAPIATIGSLVIGKLPALVAARWPDLPISVHLLSAAAPAALAVFITILSEQRAFLLTGIYEPPRMKDRLRMAGLPLALPLVIAGALDLLFLSFTFRIYYESYTWIQLVTMGAAAILLFIIFPRLVFMAIPTRPLAPGPLLELFQSVAHKINVRVAEFRVASTGNSISNAALIGGLGRRRVVLTDRILSEHPVEELVAVVGHELGHARGRHLRIFTIFLFTIGIWTLNIPESWIEPLGAWGSMAAGLAIVLIILRFGLGPIARTCEHEADLHGARAAGAIAPIVQSLERIAGPERREHASWRHPSVAARVAFLEKALAEPELAMRPRRNLNIIERVCAGLLLAGIVVTVWNQINNLPKENVLAAIRKSDFTKAIKMIEAHPNAEWESLLRLAKAGASTGGAGDKSMRYRARATFLRGDFGEAADFARLAALRSNIPTDTLFASVLEGLADADAVFVNDLLSGPASFVARDPQLGPAVRRALEAIATQPATRSGKSARRE
ncbi:MAG: M48 family metalloprotease [Planctomycetota bacterium]